MIIERKGFVLFFFFQGWWAIQLGFHLDLQAPNIEIHIPFGFIRIGWDVVRKFKTSGQQRTFRIIYYD